MTTNSAVNAASSAPSSAGRSAASRKAESAGNPFQQMLTEEISNKSHNSSKIADRSNDSAASKKTAPASSEAQNEKPTPPPAANTSDKIQNATEAAASKEENLEANASTLPPELAAMVNSLLQRQAAGNGTGDKDVSAETSASLLSGRNMPGLTDPKLSAKPEPDLQASLQLDTSADAELDLLAAGTSQAAVDGAGEEARPAGFSSMLQQLSQTGQARNAHPATSTHVAPRVGSSGWDQAIGQRVVWMAGGAEQSASLTLNPPELGPLQVVLTVTNNQANATFVAPHADVRQALEAAMPKLREMLEEAGIQLGQSSVSQGTPQEQGEFARSQSGSRENSGEHLPDIEEAANGQDAGRRVTSSGSGLINTFA